MKGKFAAAFIMAALFGTTAAVAQEIEKPENRRKEMIKRLDTDNDGKISMAEAEKSPKGKLKENFAAIDTNKDSFLDESELKAFMEVRREKRMVKKKGE
ncbi:hypothetical protein OGH69_15510 [Flavobacterium sp. MFBS3-15]|uniref:hypothetical protein n=1 Tax=Flavobacterium sp. MFBS3-15 TaxID=2989816 RepID=UPI0022361D10|nr:hypothetical protein [Flavobacterium sp. MFBS3-15]MCW4470380.1 hypothetical protein [Flavobacterium sp. MFBS3-15]